jgi:hypothetical protein
MLYLHALLFNANRLAFNSISTLIKYAAGGLITCATKRVHQPEKRVRSDIMGHFQHESPAKIQIQIFTARSTSENDLEVD